MDGQPDAIEWMRKRWLEHGQPGVEHFVAMAALMRTHQAVVARIDSELKAHALSRSAYLLMTTLQMSRGCTRPLGELSRHLMVHPTTVTMVVDMLEARGLVQRRTPPTDRRTILATLTPAGIELVSQATETLALANFGLTDVSEELSSQLVEILRDVRKQVGDAG